ncbi:hypothetical protein [Myceligenerans pegani]|uniref:Uncharacterized protein n=1 Tax=Myceligenerans pegani TaxID=2776917 RepID=A0ABR9MZN0_9MICO|nr:hypothetical protein [Myceligenerans sp. TRM 65318]MBE1876858.1 hypothetical protein [Myceligenerans sp. TRM 65318]MBE3019129.1 hypothetical protein [Myceligenerans sp. TRM 65318]
MTATIPEPVLGGQVWNDFAPGTRLTVKEYVDAIGVLNQGVLASYAGDEPGVLIDQLRATLSLGTLYSSLPLPTASTRQVRELVGQIAAINDQLITWADEALRRSIDRPEPLFEPLAVRSHCYGHNLIPQAARDLRGPEVRSPFPMMMYNEWIHQMVLLRDALLPFANWREVPLPVDGRGLRRIEGAREKFLSELLVRQIRHTAIVDYARHVLVPGDVPETEGYGFSYAGGSVLPAVVRAGTVLTPTNLLRWADDGATEDVSTYVTARADYFGAPRTDARTIRAATGATALGDTTATIRTVPGADDTLEAVIAVRAGDVVAEVDLGQALRGHRYADPVTSVEAGDIGSEAAPEASATVLDPLAVLLAPGLVWADEGGYVVPAGSDGLMALALLGQVYPEDVAVRREPGAGVLGVQPGRRARFVITLPGSR